MKPSLILSLFPGIDLLGMGFEQAGYCVLRGPDPLFAGDIRNFHMPANVVEGIIGGSPCQGFSGLNRKRNGNAEQRAKAEAHSREMLAEFQRVVAEAAPTWWLLENVPGVPAVQVPGYTVQRLHVRASEFGASQHRLRIFQFGYRDRMPLILRRPVTKPVATERAALASDGKNAKRKAWPAFCALQGLVPAPELESFTQSGRYTAVGNGVHRYVANAIAQAMRERWRLFCLAEGNPLVCACECGRPVEGRAYATTACRKRAQRKRDAAATRAPGNDTPAQLRRCPHDYRVGECPQPHCNYEHGTT